MNLDPRLLTLGGASLLLAAAILLAAVLVFQALRRSKTVPTSSALAGAARSAQAIGSPSSAPSADPTAGIAPDSTIVTPQAPAGTAESPTLLNQAALEPPTEHAASDEVGPRQTAAENIEAGVTSLPSSAVSGSLPVAEEAVPSASTPLEEMSPPQRAADLAAVVPIVRREEPAPTAPSEPPDVSGVIISPESTSATGQDSGSAAVQRADRAFGAAQQPPPTPLSAAAVTESSAEPASSTVAPLVALLAPSLEEARDAATESRLASEPEPAVHPAPQVEAAPAPGPVTWPGLTSVPPAAVVPAPAPPALPAPPPPAPAPPRVAAPPPVAAPPTPPAPAPGVAAQPPRPRAVVHEGALRAFSRTPASELESTRLHEGYASQQEVSGFAMSAPVEMWFGESHVGVRHGTKTWEQFRRYADVLLGDLKEPGAQDR